MKKRLYFLGSLVSCALLLYAIPRFPITNPQWDEEYIFTIAWFTFAFLVIAAQLYRLLGMDDDQEQRLEKIRQMRRKRQEEMWQRMLRNSHQRSR